MARITSTITFALKYIALFLSFNTYVSNLRKLLVDGMYCKIIQKLKRVYVCMYNPIQILFIHFGPTFT